MLQMAFLLPETLPAERRGKIDPTAMLRSAIYLMRDSRFMGLTLIGGFSLASFFVFIAAAPLVYMTQYQLTPTAFSLVFALTRSASLRLPSLPPRLVSASAWAEWH